MADDGATGTKAPVLRAEERRRLERKRTPTSYLGAHEIEPPVKITM